MKICSSSSDVYMSLGGFSGAGGGVPQGTEFLQEISKWPSFWSPPIDVCTPGRFLDQLEPRRWRRTSGWASSSSMLSTEAPGDALVSAVEYAEAAAEAEVSRSQRRLTCKIRVPVHHERVLPQQPQLSDTPHAVECAQSNYPARDEELRGCGHMI